jgi:hypothetical protein
MKISKTLIIFLFSTIATAQDLTISTSGGDVGPISGTNWGISDNVLYVGSSGSASINASVITNHLQNTGDLTINLPGQLNVARNININSTIAYSGSSARTLTFQSGNDIVFANAVGITSATASLNIVLRSATTTFTPNNGLVKMDSININTKGGHLWVGGGASTTTWNGLNVGNSIARTYLDDNAGISLVGSTIASGGGKIFMFAQSWNTGDDDGVNYGINFENSVMSSGIGTIYLAGGVYGRYNNGIGMRVYGTSATSITSTTGEITIYGYGTDAITNGNSWRVATQIQGSAQIKSVSGNITVTGDAAFTATVNDKEGLNITDGASICSQTGNITLRGTNTLESSGQYSNSIRFAAANAANSIRIGYDGANAYSGNISIEGNSIYQRSTHAGAGSIAVQTTGTLTIQPTGTAFTYMRAGNDGAGGSLTFDDDWNFGTNLGGFVYGKSTNTKALTYSNALTTNGPITMYAGTLTQNGAVSSGGAITFNCSDFALGDGKNLSTSTASDITINANGYFDTSGSTRRTISSANGNIIIHADKDANGSGMISIDYLTFNPGSGATIIRGETVNFFTGSVNGPYINGTGAFTFQSSDASFGSAINTSWFEIDQDNNGIGGITIGKAGSIAEIYQDRAISTTGPVNMYGNNIAISAALTATNSDLSLYANTAVTQTSPIIAAGLSLNGTGTFTLTNTSNNFTTIAGGAVGSLLGATQIIDVSGGLTIGTVGSTSGLTGSNTIRVETLAGNLTLAGSISTTSTSTDAVILTAAKSTAIGVGTGGDIIISGEPTITMGSGGIGKLFSGLESTSSGLTTLAGGSSNVRYNYDETTSTFSPVLSANNRYAIYRTSAGVGALTIVSSNGDAINSTWTYENGIINTISGTVNILSSVIENYLATGPLTINAGNTTVSSAITSTSTNALVLNANSTLSNTQPTTTVNAAITNGGSITMYGGLITLNSNLTTTASGGAILVKATDQVNTADSRTFTTNNGDFILWCDSDNSSGGRVWLGNNNVINTANGSTSSGLSGGGKIVLAGGLDNGANGGTASDGIPDGFASNASSIGLYLGNTASNYTQMYSGGGDILVRGASTLVSSSVQGLGVYSDGRWLANSGKGSITIHGTSAWYYGINFSSPVTNTTSGDKHLQLISDKGYGTAISITGTGSNHEGVVFNYQNPKEVLATGGGAIVINGTAGIYGPGVFLQNTDILATSGDITVNGSGSGTAGIRVTSYGARFGSRAGTDITSSTSNIRWSVNSMTLDGLTSGFTNNFNTTGTATIEPSGTSFASAVTVPISNFTIASTVSGLTIGKTTNTANVTVSGAISLSAPIAIYGGTVAINAALTATGSSLTLGASTALSQSAAITSGSLLLAGAGTFTLTNTSNNFTTIAGGAVGSLLGATQIIDVSGGLTIGTVGSNTGLTGSSTIRVETLAGDLTLAGSISTTSTSTDAVILTAAKSTAIGVGTGGDIIISGVPTITMGSGGIGKLFSGLESTSSGLTTLAGGSSNVRYNYDETTSTFSPVLSANNKHAIYRTNAGVGELTIVSSNGDAINSTWTYTNGVISTIATPVNILASVVESYLSSGPLTINAGNTTVNSAISSASSNALVFNANSTLTNTTPTTTVNAAITNAGSITINTGTFNVAQNITTTSTAAITISATNQISTSTDTRRIISTQGGNITLNADNDANGIGWLDIDDLTLNPGTGNLIVRGETFNVNGTESRKPYINGTGSFTFEPNDASFGQSMYTSWFVIDQDNNGISGLNFGKSGNAVDVYLNTALTVVGPISAYGNYVGFTGNMTSSANGDIFIKSLSNGNPSVSIGSGITINKSAGTGTLTFQANGRVTNNGTLSATGTGRLNVVMWSDFDNTNNDGGVSQMGTISTNNGHVWMGGSSSNGGSYIWNDLTVGDGPSIGTSGYNCNALDFWGPITTGGGDVLLWANSPGCGPASVSLSAYLSPFINSGSGDITLIAPYTSGAIELTSTGVISLVPHAGSYASALNLGGTLTSGNFAFNTSHYNGLKINSLANSGLVIGNYSGHMSGVTAVTQGNTSTVTASSALSTKSLEIYGGEIALNENLNTTTGTSSGNVLIKGSGDVILAASKSITTSGAPVILWANSDNGATNGSIALRNGSSVVTGSSTVAGGHIWIGGGSIGTTWNGLAVGSGHAVPGTQFIPSDSGGYYQPIGIYLERNSISSFGGNIKIAGDGAASGVGIVTYGNTVAVNAGSGRIDIDGQVTSTATGNRQGILFGLHDKYIVSTVNILSSASSGDAITINGVGRGIDDAIGLSGTLNITSSGGGNIVMNGNALGTGRSIVAGNFYHGILNIFANSGNIRLNGNTKAVQVATAADPTGLTSGPSKINIGQGGSITSSTSDVFITADNIALADSGIAVNSTGKVTVESSSSSFASALTFPISNLSLANTVSGLTLGKATNTQNITFGGVTTIAGPITAYGGTIALDANLTTTNNGDISLYTDNALGGLTTTARTITAAGSFNYIPRSDFFSAPVSYPINNLTLASSGLLIGKSTNTANITFANTTTVAGPITAYGGTITLNANLTTTNNGAISLYSDNALGGLSTARTLTAAGAFKYIPRVTTFTDHVTYPIANLTATSTGLTIGKTTNDKNITITQDVTGPFGIELYGNNVNINSNLTTTGINAIMYLKGNTTIAAGKSITSGGNFTHDGTMTFKSTATGTAAFGTLGGTFTTVSGASTVERYIPAKRAYRFISPSVTTTTSIRDNWQENGGTDGGLGTHITGLNGSANGFDSTTTNNPSLYTINHTTGAWTAVVNTNVNTLSAGTAYRLMVRGDRLTDLTTNTPTTSATTLRATGALYTGNHPPTLNQASEGYSFVGNPYQAPVDIKAVLAASTNMNTGVVYYWDPTLNDRGAYITRNLASNQNSPSSNFNQYLQPGQAVFVKKAATASLASMLFTESNKSVTNSAAGVFRTTTEFGTLRTNLRASINNQWTTIEGALAVFSPMYSWEITQDDANKFSNLDEEVSFMQNSTSLAIACQPNPSATNELPIRLNTTRHTNYQWQFELGNYSGPTPYLFDTQNNTYTQIENNTIVPFTVNGQELTRFKIVFQNGTLSTPDFSNQIVLYPNPGASGASSFNIEGITDAQVSLFTLLGQNIPVRIATIGKGMEVISKTSLSKGVYLVCVTKDGKTSHVKWIVE